MLQLRAGARQTFIITNSAYKFVDCGLRHVLGNDWRDLFDVVVVSAHKPDFFTSNRPFRHFNPKRGVPDWSKVTKFLPGHVYADGNMTDFATITGWCGRSVLYFGDHVYGDLADPQVSQDMTVMKY